jgi:nucleoside-diphosphate-sugar epimerase
MLSRLPEQSISSLRSSLSVEDRILILGASGWFGKTLTAMLLGGGQELMLIGSYPRILKVDESQVNILDYNFDSIRRFEPTIVVDFAFLTREKVGKLGLVSFRQVNEKLINQLVEVSELPSVKRVLFTSSGAAVYPHEAKPKNYEQDPYGYLKFELECRMEDFARVSRKSVLCLRPWSVSGTFVDRPMDYAFSSIIIQALNGKVRLEARQPVLRRYCSVDDMLAVAFALGPGGRTNTYRLLESGGELSDLGSLAKKVVDLIGNGATIIQAIDSDAKADSYFSNNKSWSESCNAIGYEARDLTSQIRDSISYYRNILPLN